MPLKNIATATSGRPATLLAAMPATWTPISDRAAWVVANYLGPASESVGSRAKTLHGSDLESAMAYVADTGWDDAPASYSVVQEWLRPISTAVRAKPTSEALAERIAAVAWACSDLPGWAFNEDTQRAAARNFAWWPAAADVWEFLNEQTKGERAKIAAVKVMIAYSTRGNTQ